VYAKGHMQLSKYKLTRSIWVV